MTDPRIEAAAKVVGPAVHHWHTFGDGRCPGCQDVAREALAAADEVDPLRNDDTLHALVARGIAARYGPQPPDWEDNSEARLVVEVIRRDSR